jgi:hypothetical protein
VYGGAFPLFPLGDLFDKHHGHKHGHHSGGKWRPLRDAEVGGG